MSHNNQKKIAVINDLSGFGRCSITVALPVISYLRIQCCPLPTSIFSNHTGYSDYFFDDYTSHMEEYAQKWNTLDLKFQGIATGFLGSEKQIEIIRNCIHDFREEGTQILVDPVMGDHGSLYSKYTPKMCEEMKHLVKHANIVTPNITEACILTSTTYKKENWKHVELLKIANSISLLGPDKVVITGIDLGTFIGNFVFEKNGPAKLIRTKKVGTERAGTGDLFASILIADAVNKVPFFASVKRAADFIKKCILASEKLNIPPQDGVCFEELLHTLKWKI